MYCRYLKHFKINFEIVIQYYGNLLMKNNNSPSFIAISIKAVRMQSFYVVQELNSVMWVVARIW